MKFASFHKLCMYLLLCCWMTVCDISSLCAVSFISIWNNRATLKITQKHWMNVWITGCILLLTLTPSFIEVIVHKNAVITYSLSFVIIYSVFILFGGTEKDILVECSHCSFQYSKSEWDRRGRALSKYHHKSSQYQLSYLFCTCSNLISLHGPYSNKHKWGLTACGWGK